MGFNKKTMSEISIIVRPAWNEIEYYDNNFPMNYLPKYNLPSKSSNPSQVWTRFCQTTTGHGFSRLVDENEPTWMRIFWGSAVTMLSVALLISVSIVSYESLVVRGLRSEFIIKHNDSMELPDIHICDTSVFNKTILEEFGLNDTMASYLALTLSPNLVSHSLRLNAERQNRLKFTFDQLLTGRSIQDIFEKATLRCTDIVLGCVRETIRLDSVRCCNQIFGNQIYVTHMATLCISTHGQPPLEEYFASQVFGLAVFLKTNPFHRVEFDSSIISPSVATKQGVVYAISNKLMTVDPVISSDGHVIGPGTWTAVPISLIRTDNTELLTAPLSPWSCVPPRSRRYLHRVPYYQFYSQENCIYAAVHTVIEKKFNCSMFRFHSKGHFLPCHPSIMINAYSTEMAEEIKQLSHDCPEDCVRDEYLMTSSTSSLSLGGHDDMHVNEPHDERIIHSAIHFFFPKFTFNIIKNHPGSLVKWLSDIGGNMSFYLGASLVTLLEVFVLFLRFIQSIAF